MTETIRAEILAAEAQRCSALMAGDISALGALMSDDLVHVHGNGKIDGKDAYLDGVAKLYVFHGVERGKLNIRLYGNVAVVVGTLQQTVSVRGVEKINEISAITTQTWLRDAAGWKQTTCHNAFLP
jgi:ketosteroid isomerase-like protein